MTDDLYNKTFQATARKYYEAHGRHDLPWRLPEADGSFDAYKILVSELMLQQTQVGRVIPKYQEFISEFPSIAALAHAPLAMVLQIWSGLGYNRRAKFLHQTAQQVMVEYNGQLPDSVEELRQLPGVGVNTAGAIVAYAFNQPVVFVETNIRTVFIHHFFHDQTTIPDKQILELVDQTLDRQHPREWYWALMDYGSYLKQTVGNLNRHSNSYAKQSKFEGSKRQIRGQVIQLLTGQSRSKTELSSRLPDERLSAVLDELLAEGMIHRAKSNFYL